MNEENPESAGYEPVDETAPAPAMPRRLTLRRDTIVVEGGAELPSQWCVKCGKPARKVINKALRNPMNPATWFGGRVRVPVGLCRKHGESRAVAVAATWSLFAVGAVIAIGSLLSLKFVGFGVGLLAVLFSGVFRATSPVSSKYAESDCYEIEGSGPEYREELRRGGFVTERDD